MLAVDLGIGPAQPRDRHLVQFGPESTIENDGALQGEQADARGSVPRHGSVDHHRFSSMTTSSSSTATTTMYASPSRDFLMRPVDLLD